MKLKILYWILIAAIVLLSVGGMVKSCLVEREKEQLEKRIKEHEQAIKDIQQKRDSANAVRIPFSERGRDSVVGSIKRKTGLNLHLRNKNRN